MLNAVALLIPVFLLLVFFEWYISYKRKNNRYSAGNITMNLTIGAIDQVCSLFYFALMYTVLKHVYDHYRIIEINNGWYQWVVGYIAVDFLSYWYHRLSHSVNILWAGHVTHHSSELFNFSNGFRTSVFQGINRILFWAFLPVFGFSPVTLVIILKISGVYDFLLHTEYIPKLGFLEKILITPSQHRVHHGKNDIYIDKNYGSTLVIWDKIFGTYQEENEKVIYGIKSPYIDNNPITAIGHHYHYLWKSMKATRRWSDKIKLWFMPPEWKPRTILPYQPALPEKKSLITPYLKHYVLFQISSCVAGIIVLLSCQDFLRGWEIILCSTVALVIMTNVTKVINENRSIDFEKKEANRLIAGLILMFATLFLNSNVYLWAVIILLSVSLVLIITAHMHRLPD